jgi:putative IMPACT (imprinted ancient) family translation regulator
VRTVRKRGEAKLVRERSRFLSFAYPASTEGEAMDLVVGLRRRYHDAHHVAYAYRISVDGRLLERADDAGEPSRSAGWPILELLRGKELVNVLVVVVRYFGGVKLGVGNLRRAYRDAAALALEEAGIVEFVPRVRLRLGFAPGDSGRAFPLISRLGAEIRSREYADGRVVLTVEVPRGRAADIREAVRPWGDVEPVE